MLLISPRLKQIRNTGIRLVKPCVNHLMTGKRNEFIAKVRDIKSDLGKDGKTRKCIENPQCNSIHGW